MFVTSQPSKKKLPIWNRWPYLGLAGSCQRELALSSRSSPLALQILVQQRQFLSSIEQVSVVQRSDSSCTAHLRSDPLKRTTKLGTRGTSQPGDSALGPSWPAWGVASVGYPPREVDSLTAWHGGASWLSQRVAASDGQLVQPRLGRRWGPALGAGLLRKRLDGLAINWGLKTILILSPAPSTAGSTGTFSSISTKQRDTRPSWIDCRHVSARGMSLRKVTSKNELQVAKYDESYTVFFQATDTILWLSG